MLPFPDGFRCQEIANGEAILHVRLGGTGPAIVMLHGFGGTGDMWAPLAAELCGDHTVIAPDLRGMGLSSHPSGGYDKRTQATDIACVLDSFDIRRIDLVTHDIGNMVGYAFAALYPERVTRFIASTPVGVPAHEMRLRCRREFMDAHALAALYGRVAISIDLGHSAFARHKRCQCHRDRHESE